ncbi:hypothetical protein NCAS_0B03080 [Naumovozyma castellii]|uniref:Phosducin domain-containing protein n=1 Tax=Naumovozyma castellii TaxID=27288 RepID=G0VBR6_NAUCA|nr:hypothetical protein NCAS_0B03080 [Naumovozyma castellii CBS 4309]CCC68392.1 hypothetical protein NCAS_0B03080 [Naumovozyma castellii CBS 4309]
MDRKIDAYEKRVLDGTRDQDDDSDLSLEELLDELDEESDQFFSKYREQRMEEISDHLKKVSKNVNESGYGILVEVEKESELIRISKDLPKIVIHFGLDTFEKCRYMNERLETLARKYLDTKFVKVDVQKCPFLVQKLRIKVLPFVIGYCRGVESMRLVGFSQLGNDPNGFKIEMLEKVLLSSGVIKSFSGTTLTKDRRILSSRSHDDEGSDSGLDI